MLALSGSTKAGPQQASLLEATADTRPVPIGDNRLRENWRGELEVAPKPIGYIIGEQVVRPILDALAHIWNRLPTLQLPGARAAPVEPGVDAEEALQTYRQCLGPVHAKARQIIEERLKGPPTSEGVKLNQEEQDRQLACQLRAGGRVVKRDHDEHCSELIRRYRQTQMKDQVALECSKPIGLQRIPFPLIPVSIVFGALRQLPRMLHDASPSSLSPPIQSDNTTSIPMSTPSARGMALELVDELGERRLLPLGYGHFSPSELYGSEVHSYVFEDCILEFRGQQRFEDEPQERRIAIPPGLPFVLSQEGGKIEKWNYVELVVRPFEEDR